MLSSEEETKERADREHGQHDAENGFPDVGVLLPGRRFVAGELEGDVVVVHALIMPQKY